MNKYLVSILIILTLSTMVFSQSNGYKDVPWGASIDEFKKIKNYEGDLNNGIVGHAAMKTAIAITFDTPIFSAYGMSEVQMKYIPSGFSYKYIDSDSIYYIFFNGKFAMAISEVAAKNYSKYYDEISKKYKLTNTIEKTITVGGTEPNTHNCSIFSNNNNKVSLIKHTIKSGGYIYTSVY